MGKQFLPVLYNKIGKYVSKNLKSTAKFPGENKTATACSSNLPSISKHEDVKIQNIPTIDFTPIKNVIDVPLMVSSFFNKRMNDVFKDLLFIEPIKHTEVLGKQQWYTTAEFSDKGMTIAIEMKGFKEEDINIRIEGPWLVIEGQSSISVPEKEGGGLHVKHIIRRYEVPPNSDVANIKSNFKNEMLTITIPSLQPKISKKLCSSFTPWPSKPLTVRNYFNYYKCPPQNGKWKDDSKADKCKGELKKNKLKDDLKESKVTKSSSAHTDSGMFNDKWKDDSKADKCKDELKRNKLKDDLKESKVTKSSSAHTDNGMFVQLNVKGFKKEDIEVKVEGTALEISVQRLEDVPQDKGGGKYFQQVYRTYKVPPNSDLDNITAEMSGDLLKISVPTVKPAVKWKGSEQMKLIMGKKSNMNKSKINKSYF